LQFAAEAVFHIGEAAGELEVVVLLEAAESLLVDDGVDEWCCGEDVVGEVSDDDNNSHNHHSHQQPLHFH